MNTRIIYVLAILLLLFVRTASAASVEGELRWLKRVELGFAVSGIITDVPARTGEPVTKGTVLASLDSRSFEAEVKRAEAKKIYSGKLLEEASRELKRAKELFERTVLSEHELQLAHIGHKEANARHQKASANLVRAKMELDYSSIKAPFDGMVISKMAEAGKTVIASLKPEPQFVFAQSGQMLAYIEVDNKMASRLAPGTEMDVEVAGLKYKGKILSLGMEPVSRKQTVHMYPVEIVFNSSTAKGLRAGMPVEVDLP